MLVTSQLAKQFEGLREFGRTELPLRTSWQGGKHWNKAVSFVGSRG
jgi:hypothetical protein